MADVINKKYDIEIEVVTPLSIGAGAEKDWVKGVDFVVEKGKLYKLNLRKMASIGIDISKLTTYFAEKNEKSVLALIGGKLKEVSDKEFNMPISTQNDIKSFVKNQLSGNPIIAGSSIKGAVRSVLFDYLRTNETNDKVVFGSSTKGDEFMRFIKFSDSEFDKTELVNTKIFNLQNKESWQGGWKHEMKKTNSTFSSKGFNTVYECIMPGNKSDASIMFSSEVFNKVKEQPLLNKKVPIIAGGLNKLFAIINNHTKEYLQKELAFFKKYSQADKTDEIIDSIEDLISNIPTDNSYCLLKMSAGSGFHSITGDWQFDDYGRTGTWTHGRNAGKPKYKSRKIAIYNDVLSLMGFVKISLLSEEEKQHRIARKKQLQKEREEAAAKALAEQKEKEQEDESLKQKAIEERQKFDSLVSEAQRLQVAEQWEDALAKFLEAKKLMPNCNTYDYEIESLRIKVAQIEREKVLAYLAEEKKKANQIPLSEKIANATKLQTMYGNVKQWMKQNELIELSEDDKQVLKAKIAQIYSSMKSRDQQKLKTFGKELDELISPELAKQWFDEIVNK